MKKKKRPMTILEIMIVIFIIGIVGGVVGYNMKGTIEQGKAFKTKEGIGRLYELFHYEMATNDRSLQYIQEHWKDIVKNSGFIKNPAKFIKDGWGQEYNIRVVSKDFRIESPAYNRYLQKKGLEAENPWEDDAASQ